MRKYIAPLLLKDEYLCKCCGDFPVDFFVEKDEAEIATPFLMLFKHFQDIREAWSKPIPVTSGYRCPKRNKAVGGHPYSVHLFGLALDLDCKDEEEVSKMALLIKQIAPNLRKGIYKEAGTFIHIDVGYYIYPKISRNWSGGVTWYG